MSEWQPIETAPVLKKPGDFHKCDLIAETWELADATSGRVRKVQRRFCDAERTMIFGANQFSNYTYENPLSWRVVTTAPGLNTSWKVTHWMPTPDMPNDNP